jgi:hypothetical protein
MPAGLNKDQREAAKQGGGGLGGGSGNGGELSTKDRNLNALDSLRGGRAMNLDQKTGKGTSYKDKGGRGAGFVPEKLVPSFSRQKVKKTTTRPGTAGNIITGALTALGLGPFTAIGTVAGSEEVTGIEGGLMKDLTGLGYEGPIGEGERVESDPSQLGENKSLTTMAPPTKKKKNNPLGSQYGTLLADAGGSLVAG